MNINKNLIIKEIPNFYIDIILNSKYETIIKIFILYFIIFIFN